MRILAWDIETLPMIVPTWRLFKANVRQDSIIESTSLVCAAWRFVDEEETYAVSILDKPKKFTANIYDDEHVVKKLYKVLDSGVDILLHQNGDKFDWKKFHGRVAYYGLPPLPKFRTIDTLKQARKHFALDSNKLDFIGRFFGLGQKIDTGGMELWDNIVQLKYPPVGEKPNKILAENSIRFMVKYNIQDVDLLIAIFERIKPYIDVPNRMLYEGQYDGCPACRSSVYKKQGMAYTSLGVYQRYKCLNKECGKRFQDTKRIHGSHVR